MIIKMRHTKFSGVLRYERSPNFGQTTRRSDSQQNKKTKKREPAEFWTSPFRQTTSKTERKR